MYVSDAVFLSRIGLMADGGYESKGLKGEALEHVERVAFRCHHSRPHSWFLSRKTFSWSTLILYMRIEGKVSPSEP